MLEYQLARRNLQTIQKIAIVEKYRPIFEKQAKERQATSTGGVNPQLTQNFVEADKKIIKLQNIYKKKIKYI